MTFCPPGPAARALEGRRAARGPNAETMRRAAAGERLGLSPDDALKLATATFGGATALLIGSLLWQIAHMVYPATWAFFAEIALGWNAQQIGWSLAASGVAMMLTQIVVVGPAIRVLGEGRTVLVGLGIGVIVFGAYVFVDRGWQAYALIAVGTLMGLVFPSINAILSRRVDAANQGALQGGMASIASVAAIAGPLMMTQALAFGTERGVPGAAFGLASALCAVTFLVFLFGVALRRGRLA